LASASKTAAANSLHHVVPGNPGRAFAIKSIKPAIQLLAPRGSAATRPVLPTNMALPGQVREAKNAVSGSSRRPADPRPELEVRTSRFASKIMKERAIV